MSTIKDKNSNKLSYIRINNHEVEASDFKKVFIDRLQEIVRECLIDRDEELLIEINDKLK